MASTRDSFVDLERYRLQLEDNVAKLKASLLHWQTWEAEYEGMKEEIDRLGEQHTKADLAQLAGDFGGELLNDKEIKLLLADSNGQQRDSSQVIGLLSRRIDYVQENIKMIEKQIEKAEDKVTLSRHISRPEVRDEEGLPLTDIREELDEEGNVISGVATLAADRAPRIVETLRKAGVDDLPDTPKRKLPDSEPNRRGEEVNEVNEAHDSFSESLNIHTSKKPPKKALKENQAINLAVRLTTSDVGNGETSSLKRKKSVTFAEGTKTEDSNVSRKRQANPIFMMKPPNRGPPAIATAETVLDVQQKPPEEQLTALLNAEANLMRGQTNDGLDMEITSPVIPEDESADDAALRRQMLQYNMQEVGAVVAEIDLDDDASTPPYSEDEDGYDYDDSSVEEEEDDHGRATNIVISDEYIKQMNNLEKRLKASMMENIGPDENSVLPPSFRKESLNKSNMKHEKENTSESSGSPTKGVRFAEEIDVQEAPVDQDISALLSLPSAPTHDPRARKPALTNSTISRFRSARERYGQLEADQNRATKTQEPSQPVRNDIIERPMANDSISPPTKPLSVNPPEKSLLDAPLGPPDRPHADIIIERPFPSRSTEPPQEFDELDPELQQQQAKTEYHRQRNRMIHRQGGFLATEEDDEAEVPVDEHGNPEGKKISRFKAARLGRM